MKKELELNDIISWDTVNWSKSIPFWENNSIVNKANLNCLELGGREGGLSLWLASKDHNVICSDLENPKDIAAETHLKYGYDDIRYESINALDIPYQNHFDIITFKSILGGVSRNSNDKNQKLMIDQIFQALKPGGQLLFAENLASSPLHQFLRKHFIKWGEGWNYLKFKNVADIFDSFSSVSYQYVGFFGAFGRNETQRRMLGKIDQFLNPIIPKKMRYILIGVATK